MLHLSNVTFAYLACFFQTLALTNKSARCLNTADQNLKTQRSEDFARYGTHAISELY